MCSVNYTNCFSIRMQLPRRGLAPEFPRITVGAKFRELCAINNAGARWFNPKVPRARVDHNFAGDGICVAIHQQELLPTVTRSRTRVLLEFASFGRKQRRE